MDRLRPQHHRGKKSLRYLFRAISAILLHLLFYTNGAQELDITTCNLLDITTCNLPSKITRKPPLTQNIAPHSTAYVGISVMIF
jgi:hypothetical protein